MRPQLRVILSELSKPHQNLCRTKILHSLIIKSCLSNDPFFGTKLVRFYGINDDIYSARQLFDRISNRSVYLWNSIIRAYAKARLFFDAFSLFKLMLRSANFPDNFTFACVLRAFGECFCPEGIRIVHGEAVVLGLGLDSVCCSALVSAYSKLGCAEEGIRVFNGILEPDLVLWNSMISCYGCSRNWDQELDLFNRMRNARKCQPDGYTMVALISNLADPIVQKKGETIHGFCLKFGFDSSDHVCSSLVSMYSRYKCMDSACKVFCSLSWPDLVTWSSLVTGFSENGQHDIALDFFRKMIFAGMKADAILLTSTLSASSHLTSVEPGRQIHGYVVRHGYSMEVTVSSALVDMYAKCGFLDLVIRVFEKMPKKNVVTYNLLISCLGLHGLPLEAFKRFEEMLQSGIRPDAATFSGLLGACCHAGLVKEGREYFKKMRDRYGFLAETQHYVHMVKLLGMAGELKEAYELVQCVPEPVDPAIWGALLSCCEVHRNTKLAEITASKIHDHKPSYKVMLSNINAGEGRWTDVQKLRLENLDLGRVKVPGISWIIGDKSPSCELGF